MTKKRGRPPKRQNTNLRENEENENVTNMSIRDKKFQTLAEESVASEEKARAEETRAGMEKQSARTLRMNAREAKKPPPKKKPKPVQGTKPRKAPRSHYDNPQMSHPQTLPPIHNQAQTEHFPHSPPLIPDETNTHQSHQKQVNRAKLVKQIHNVFTNKHSPFAYSGNIRGIVNEATRTLSLHAPKKKNFKRRYTTAFGKDHSAQMDLVDYTKFKHQNNGFGWIFVLVMDFSGKMYAVPLKEKKGKQIEDAMEKILGEMEVGEWPKLITADQGTEFFKVKGEKAGQLNQFMKNISDRYRIIIYSLVPPIKGGRVERYNQTLKNRLERYFTENETKKWIDVLQDIVNSINNTTNRITKKTPNEVTASDDEEIWGLRHPVKKAMCKLEIGDIVRTIIKKKDLGAKGYEQNWSNEKYKIFAVFESPSSACYYKVYHKNENNKKIIILRLSILKRESTKWEIGMKKNYI